MSKFVFCLLILMICCSGSLFSAVAAAEKITVPAGVDLFEKADVFSTSAGKLPFTVTVDASEGRIGFSSQHPVAWYNYFYPLSVNGKRYFAAGGNAGGGMIPSRSLMIPFQWSVLLFSSLFLPAWIWWMRRKRYPAGSGMDDLGKIGIAVIVRWILLSAVVAWWINVIPAASDDPGYFQSALDILHGSWKGPWNYTIGLGIFYMPFILIFRAASFYDIAVAFDWFSGFVIAPAAMALGYCLLRKLKLSSASAFAAVMTWAVWPFLAYHLEGWETQLFPAFWSVPPLFADTDFFVWKYYAICINSGFNALSDTPGMMMLFAAMLYAFKCRLRPLPVLAAGALWGAACLIRINYILFLPFFIWLGSLRVAAGSTGTGAAERWKRLLNYGILAAAGFLLIFGIQLFINYHHFGSPLTFGYILHYTDFAPVERPAAGFTLHTLLKWQNLRHLAMANHFWWTPGLTGLLFTRDPFRRNALVWWSLPLVIFFLGYSHTYCDARRFILPVFIAFIGAFTGMEVWQRQSRMGRDRYVVGAILGFCWIFTTPFFHGYGLLPAEILRYTPPVSIWSFAAAAAAVCVMSVLLWQKKERRLLGVLLFGSLYYWFAAWQLTGMILIFITGRALYDLLRPAGKSDITPGA